MVRMGWTAFQARKAFDPAGDMLAGGPVWCFDRFGQTRTALPDGRVICIGGEHEDYYDPDFHIYNDVIVVTPQGQGDAQIEIYGYPKSVFAPTDFHTATLYNDGIFIVGGLGYFGERGGDETPVYRLDLRTYAIRRLPTSGQSPGWIYGHRARLVNGGTALRIWGGKTVRTSGRKETMEDYKGAADLLLRSLEWQLAGVPDDPDAPPDVNGLAWPEGWEPVCKSDDADFLMSELRRAVAPGHPLFALEVRPWASSMEGVLYRMLDGTGRVVQVRYEGPADADPAQTTRGPTTDFFDDLDAWLKSKAE